ncbi:MAG: colanic acid biosynthesis glycosyltransferase WcaL, partial [Blastocatellia bacterium]|nr:colanic acid biosynthesis glycosyltransferase WcaL [Blastocatellia bacterium]
MNNSKVRLAYLISRYPAISHTFILREVMSLRQMGFEISVASINNPDRKLSELTIEEQSEVARTYYVKNHGFKGALKAHTKKFFNTPFAYISALIFAMHLAGSDLKKVIYNFFYFVEAVMIGLWMQEENFSHLHIHFATPAATVGMIVEKLFSFTFSITVHGPDEFYDVSKFKLTEKIENSSFICCIGSYARSQLMKLSSP